MFYVYILQSTKTNRLYIGKTKDLKKRLGEHNNGQNTSTKPGRPWQVIFYEAYLDKNDVDRREMYLKTTQGRQAIKRMLKCYLENKAKMYFD